MKGRFHSEKYNNKDNVCHHKELIDRVIFYASKKKLGANR